MKIHGCFPDMIWFSSSIWSWRVEEKWSPKRCGKGEIYHNFSHVFEVKSRIILNAFIPWSAVDFSVIVLNSGRAANSWLRASGIPFRWLKSQWKFLPPIPQPLPFHQPICCGEIRWWNPIFLEPPGEAVLAKGEANEKLFEPLGLRWIWERSADPGTRATRVFGMSQVAGMIRDMEWKQSSMAPGEGAPFPRWFRRWNFSCPPKKHVLMVDTLMQPPKRLVSRHYFLVSHDFFSDQTFCFRWVWSNETRPEVGQPTESGDQRCRIQPGGWFFGCRSRFPLGSRLSGGLDGNNTYLTYLPPNIKHQKPWFNRGFTHI